MSSKEDILNEILEYKVINPALVIEYRRRSIIKHRPGEGVAFLNWSWNKDQLAHYSKEDLEEILDEVIRYTHGNEHIR